MCRAAPGQEERALEVEFDHRVPVRLGEVDRVGAADDAGVVDQDVDARRARRRPRATTRSTGSCRAEVGLDRMQLAPAERTHALGGLVRLARGRRATMSAPACASATAMPWPRPVLAPVTSATLPPSRSNEVGSCASLQLADVEHVHVGVVLVLAAHRPDEGVGAACPSPCGSTTAARSPLPRWRRRCAASPRGSPMKWKTRSFSPRARSRNRPRERRSCRCGGIVFQTLPGLSTVRPSSSCADLQIAGHDVLVDGALVRCLEAPRSSGIGLGDRDLARSRSARAPGVETR